MRQEHKKAERDKKFLNKEIAKYSKSKRKKHKNLKRVPIEKLAIRLQRNTPRSEKWFYNLFENYFLQTDLKNSPHLGYIPDVINHEFMYIIEIDGSIHAQAAVQRADLKKNIVFREAGYEVFRIEHYDLKSFPLLLRGILLRRERMSKLMKLQENRTI